MQISNKGVVGLCLHPLLCCGYSNQIQGYFDFNLYILCQEVLIDSPVF